MTNLHDARFDEHAGLYVLGALTRRECEALEAHLHGCEACSAEVRRLTPVASALSLSVPQVDPPLDLRRRVIAAIAPSQAPANRAGHASQRTAWSWMPIAASLALALGVSAYAWRLTDRLTMRIAVLEQGLADAVARAAAGEQRLVEVRNTMATAQSAMAILSAVDVLRVDLSGQPAAPAATARAFVSGSRGILFTASALPALPAGRVYQLWVVTPTAPVSAGLLTPDSAGNVNQIFVAPPAAARPVAVAVTDEPAGGVPLPTGRFQVMGTVTGV